MRSLRIVSRLALGLLAGGAFVASPVAIESAWAQSAPAFEGQGIIELVPPTGLVGDGTTSADLFVLAIGPDGKPIPGLKTKPTASGGTVSEMTEVGGGVYRFAFTPPKVDGPQQITLSVKGKLPSKEAYARTWMVSVAPARSRQLSVASNPGTLTLGQDRTASIALNLAGGDRQALAGVNLKVKSSSGTVENVTNLGGGQFSALFNVPAVNYPHVALVTAADSRDPSHTYGSLAVPLVGKADYPVTVAPNARVILRIGGRDFGPVQADAMGRAKVPIIVPPGNAAATIVQIAGDGKVTEAPLDLKIPEAKRIALFPTANAIPSDARVQVPVRVLVVTPEGKPDMSANVVFTTTAGVITPARLEAGGVYVALWTPPTGNAATQATIAVNLADKPAVQADAMTVNLVPARATKVTLSTEPTTLAQGADGFKVFAKVAGPDGAGMGGRELRFTTSGAKLKGDVKDLRNGDYQAAFSTTGSGPVELAGSLAATATGNPLARVLVIPGRERVPADGVSSALLTIATVDEYGYPVANVPVTLKVTRGDGTVPATATTDEHGVAQIYYTAGRKNGFVAIEAAAAEVVAGAAIVQAPADLALPDLPTSGTKAAVGLIDEWAGAIALVRLDREGMAGAVAAAPQDSWAGGAALKPSKIALTSEPATASAGGTVLLRVKVTDADGRGVGGQSLEFLSSGGTVGSVTDLGGGLYQASFSVPPTASGEVKISVASADGSVSSFMKLPIGGAESAWGSSPFAASQPEPSPFAAQPEPSPFAASTQPAQPAAAPPPPAPTFSAPPAPATSTTTVTKTPSAPSERPWLRIRGGYALASYNYSQEPLTAETALFPTAISFEEPIPAQGFSGSARVWVPTFRYVGADVGVSFARYSLDPAPLCAKLGRPCEDAGLQEDWIGQARVLAAARYPFEVGASEFSVGARVGWSMSDVQAYLKEKDSIKLEQIWINSLALGPEVHAEIGESLFFQTYFLEHLAGGSSPFDTQFGVTAGYAFVDNVYAAVAYDLSIRKVSVANASEEPIGEIADRLHGATLSVGFQY
ncbi:MAG: Ig-like domain-containing protein [Myxococcota bacterium]